MQKNFFQKLINVDFEDFVTPSVATAVYAITVVLTGVGALITLLAGLLSGDATALLAPIAGFLIILFVRILLETSVALIKIAENTKKD